MCADVGERRQANLRRAMSRKVKRCCIFGCKGIDSHHGDDYDDAMMIMIMIMEIMVMLLMMIMVMVIVMGSGK